MVECQLPKLKVVGSNPISRSKYQSHSQQKYRIESAFSINTLWLGCFFLAKLISCQQFPMRSFLMSAIDTPHSSHSNVISLTVNVKEDNGLVRLNPDWPWRCSSPEETETRPCQRFGNETPVSSFPPTLFQKIWQKVRVQGKVQFSHRIPRVKISCVGNALSREDRWAFQFLVATDLQHFIDST